jgi:hypothetical protein
MATRTSADLGPLLTALDRTSLEDARAELDGLIRLAANAADELGLLAACAADFPDSTAGDLARTGSRAAADAADELQALRRRLEV